MSARTTLGAPVLCCLLMTQVAAAATTFNRDVLPILQKNCQTCHRPGEVAPMSFLSYESTRPWAKAIKAAALTRKMPPWPADPRYGHFSNDRTLKQNEIDAIVDWVNGGAVEGDPKDRPSPVEWPDGWAIAPDVVVSMPKPFPVPAAGVLELTSITIPSGFTKDTWITSIEIRPGNRRVVHHVSLQIVPHRDDVEYGVPETKAKKRDAAGVAVRKISKADRLSDNIFSLETTYDPGAAPVDYRPYHAGKLVPAGSDFVLQMHYTTNGTATSDQTRIGFTVAKEPPDRRFVTIVPTSFRDRAHFHIPAGDANWETHTALVFHEDVEIAWLMPHMHLRGKDMTYRLVYPNGESQTLLSVRWDFNWQMGFALEKPVAAPKGSRLEVTAHFDNSANNPLNPNPNTDVWWGDQTWEEMMVPWFGVLANRNTNPDEIAAYPPEMSALSH
ncbi:MAG TPA: cytochrome c [Bryobacteraceae bacterium]|nr:cytochrome c [Bryobacteraceae bacterium]